MRVVITAATAGEIAPVKETLPARYSGADAPVSVQFHTAGVGMVATTWSLTRLLSEQQPQLVIQAGIAGCFDHQVPLGAVMAISSEHFGDTGVEENGQWRDLFSLQLDGPDTPPFENRELPNPWLQQYNLLHLPQAHAVTINTITTRPERIQQLQQHYRPTLESMEGAALHYVCRMARTPFIQLRSVSNYIGERDKSKWKIKDAIINLNQCLLQLIEAIDKNG
ncbi:futalosine hydrolase [Deminuibacter soli]|nr:futalosine hydrolase [Deminuibacter soli]